MIIYYRCMDGRMDLLWRTHCPSSLSYIIFILFPNTHKQKFKLIVCFRFRQIISPNSSFPQRVSWAGRLLRRFAKNMPLRKRPRNVTAHRAAVMARRAPKPTSKRVCRCAKPCKSSTWTTSLTKRELKSPTTTSLKRTINRMAALCTSKAK